ncbi:hypothetical protein TNCV_267151 [Trichonephila clavipes]|nr:hypothetical protein TNCV_267151 [Trichonephila clavipes]
MTADLNQIKAVELSFHSSKKACKDRDLLVFQAFAPTNRHYNPASYIPNHSAEVILKRARNAESKPSSVGLEEYKRRMCVYKKVNESNTFTEQMRRLNRSGWEKNRFGRK